MTRPKWWHAELKKCFHWFTDCPGKPNTEHFRVTDFNFKYRVKTGWQIIGTTSTLSLWTCLVAALWNTAHKPLVSIHVCLMLPTLSTYSCIRSKTRCSDYFLAFSVLFCRHVSCNITVSFSGQHAAVDDKDWTESALKQLMGSWDNTNNL